MDTFHIILLVIVIAIVAYPYFLKKLKEGNLNHPPKIDQQKQGYLELINLCVGDLHKGSLINFVNNLQDYNGNLEYGATLNYLINYLDKNNIYFIMALDWKQEIIDLVWRVDSSLKANFDIRANLPNPESYGHDKSISAKNVFKDFDKALGLHDIRLGFIDTNTDEYVILLFKLIDEDKVKNAIKRIGYNYLTSFSSKISPETRSEEKYVLNFYFEYNVECCLWSQNELAYQKFDLTPIDETKYDKNGNIIRYPKINLPDNLKKEVIELSRINNSRLNWDSPGELEITWTAEKKNEFERRAKQLHSQICQFLGDKYLVIYKKNKSGKTITYSEKELDIKLNTFRNLLYKSIKWNDLDKVDFAMWFLANGDEDFITSKILDIWTEIYKQTCLYSSYLIADILRVLKIHITDEMQIYLPQKSISFPFLTKNNDQVILTLSQEKGIRFHFSETTQFSFRMNFLVHFLDYCKAWNQMLQECKVPFDQSIEFMNWWNITIKTSRMINNQQPILNIGIISNKQSNCG